MTRPNSSNEQEHRLPRAVAPLRYDLQVAPDLDAARFDGTVAVRLDVREPVDTIVCNAADLEIHGASLVPLHAGDEPAATVLTPAVALDKDEERAVFTFPAVIPTGPYLLTVQFSGVLNDQLRGFYRSTFTDDDGTEHVIATTQFEATDARRAFPCWDEPDRKAVFSVTLDVPADLAAISNWPEVEREDLGGGRVRVRFGDTIPMSTYLLAYVVGPLELTDPLDVDGVAVRVAHRPGRAHQAAFALEAAAHALRFYVDWFNIAYPCPKLDLLAIPDFAAGAMENLGAVTFRESDLLVDPATASQPEMARVGSTVDHEIAHMWFGDLVTMRWWNGLWLNEAFATYMSILCLDDFRPQWRVWDDFGRDRSAALQIDALHSTRPIEYPVHRPEDAEGMFDLLTYEKGAAVLRMLERFVGTQRFRSGVRAYLASHLYGNTETTDLWDAIEEAAENEPVRSLMDTWIFQGGFPLVEVAATPGGITLRAEPFARLREGEHAPAPGAPPSGIGTDWLVPVIAARRGAAPPAGGAPEEGPDTARAVLASGSATLRLSGDPQAPVVANVGGYGFYRVRYDDDLAGRIAGALDRLTPLERYCVVSDSWVCAHSGVAPLEGFLSLVRRLDRDDDPGVWSVVAGALDTLDRAVPEADRPALRDFAASVLRPQLERVGWDPAEDEGPLTATLRATLVRHLGMVAEDAGVIAECTARLAADRAGEAPLAPGLAATVLAIAARHGGADEFSRILESLRQAKDPQLERRLLDALAEVADPALAARVHELCLGELRTQDGPYVLQDLLLNRHVNAGTWEFVASHWDELLSRYQRSALADMMRGTPALDSVDDEGNAPLAAAVRAFVSEHPLDGLERLVQQRLEVLEVNVAFARRERRRLGDLLRRA